MVFHWRLSDSKSPRVPKTLLSILAVFNNAVIWMVSTRPPPSKSSRPFNNPLVTVPKAPITIGIIVTFMFHSFFQFSSKVEVLISLFTVFFTRRFFPSYLIHYFSGLGYSSYLQLTKSLFLNFGNHSYWYSCHLHVQQIIQLFGKIQLLVYFFTFFYFYSVAP